MVSLYNKGLSDHAIARMLNVYQSTVRRRRVGLGLPPHPQFCRFKKLTSEQIARIKDMWTDNSAVKIAKTLGVHRHTISSWARKLKLNRKHKGRPSSADPELIRKLRLEGFTYREIAEKLKISFEAVKYQCRKMGLRRLNTINVDFEEFKKLYLEGLTYKEIADKLGISVGRVVALRNKLGLLKRKRGRRKRSNHPTVQRPMVS
ncbi:hypothetical protein KEJ27_05060 [Candidatus Bathyarchaeota archaeon]|nr:hypothetical protein [Candidatus Bathyarchaeota archaeon]